jgi:hypothetical protein
MLHYKALVPLYRSLYHARSGTLVSMYRASRSNPIENMLICSRVVNLVMARVVTGTD